MRGSFRLRGSRAVQLEHLTLDERFFCRIALKNRLVTEGALRAILTLHADLALRGNPKAVQLLCLDKGLVRARDVDRILRAQRRTQALRLDMLYARHLAALGSVDPARLRAMASERDQGERPLSERLLAQGTIDAATHQAVLRSLHLDLSADERSYLSQLNRKADFTGGAPDPRLLETQVGERAPAGGAGLAAGGRGARREARASAPAPQPDPSSQPPAQAAARPGGDPPASRRYPSVPLKRRRRAKDAADGREADPPARAVVSAGADEAEAAAGARGEAADPAAPLRKSIAEWLGAASMASDSKEDQDLLESAVDELDRLSSEDGAAVREGALRAFQRRYKKGRRGPKAADADAEAAGGAQRAVSLAWGLSVLAVVITLAAVLWDLLSNG